MSSTAIPVLPRFAPGQELSNGRLVVKGMLGQGSMGVVYRAEDRDFGRDVALKTLTNFDADRLYQLKREFRTLEHISHPNLVRLYWLGTDHDIWFVTMELIDGLDLGAWLRRTPSRDRFLRVFGQLAEGLRALHASGLMHRDVKPSNVMVTAADQAILLDFGLASPIHSAAVTLAAGTLDYIAPEQLWNDSPGAPADWYSFGVVLYQALTGVLPFSGPDRLKAMRQPLTAGPKALAPEVPDVLDDLVRRLLDPHPERRPAPDELARVLEMPRAPTSAAPAAVDAPFVGRANALRRLHEALDAVERGAVRVVSIHGPSGIGKTALARRFLSDARARPDALVLEGSCHPQESVPYKAIDALIDNLTRHLLGTPSRMVIALAPRHAAALLHLFPVLGRVPAVREWPIIHEELSPSELRRRGFDALRELLGKLADVQTVVLWIDDVQWSDRDSGVLLRALLSPPDVPQLLLLLTSRDGPGDSPLLDVLAEVADLTDVALEPLSVAESTELARNLAAAGGVEADAASIGAEAGGSPFLLGEVIRLLRGPYGGSAAGQPFTMAQVVRSRLDGLSGEARQLLEVVAIAGRPLEADLALQASGIGAAGRLLAYSLCSEHLLRISTHGEEGFLEVYHDRLREFAVSDLAADRRRTLHRSLAEAIRAGRSPDARALVHHYLAAGEGTEAAHFALLAAREADRDLAFEQAADMYSVALEHGPAYRFDRDVFERRADALANAARRTEAALAYEALAQTIGDDRESRTAIRVRAAEQFFCGGELMKGLAVLRGVLDDVGVRVSARTLPRVLGGQWRRIRFLVRGSRVSARDAHALDADARVRLDALWRATRGVVMLDPMLADVLAGIHLLEALRCGDTSRALRALGLEAAFEANIGGRLFRGRSRRLLAEAQRLAGTESDPYDDAWLVHCRAACAWFEGDWLACVTLGDEAEARFRAVRLGVTWDVTVLHGFMLSALSNLGRVQDLSRKASDLVTDAERRQDQYALRVFRTGDAVVAWLAADRADMALRVADESLIDYPADRFTSQHRHHLVATVQSHLYAGEPDEAWRRIERVWPAVRWSGFLLLDCLGTQLRYLRACAALATARAPSCRSPGRLLRLARREAGRIRRSALPMAAPMALAVEAGTAGAEGRRGAQTALLLEAAESFARADMALHCQSARWHLASLMPAGAQERETSARWMADQQVVRPASLARALVPPA